MSPRLGVAVRPLFAYWRVEQRTMRQGFVALFVASSANLVAGLTLGAMEETLERLAGLIVLIPGAIAMRGSIFGALGSRLGTTLHTGIFRPSWQRDDPLYQNVAAVTVLSFSTSLFLAVMAWALTFVFGLEAMSIAEFAVISVLGGLASSLLVGGFIVGISLLAHRRSWDLDSVSAPLVTAVGDIVTIPMLFVAALFVLRTGGWVHWAIAAILTILAVALLAAAWSTELATTRRIIHESIPILSGAAVLGVLAGVVLEAQLEGFIAFPVFLVLVPPFMANAGALGGILSARLASKLHLGVLSPRGRPEPVAYLDTSIIFVFALWLFALLGISAEILAWLLGLTSPGLVTVLAVSLIGGLLATCFGVVVAYYTAIATFRVGLDPDNHGIPIITSTMDVIGLVVLVAIMLAFGVT